MDRLLLQMKNIYLKTTLTQILSCMLYTPQAEEYFCIQQHLFEYLKEHTLSIPHTRTKVITRNEYQKSILTIWANLVALHS